ncbi:MAG: MSCRAMM family adhesin SdrC [Acidobacteriia bacterium]|nr:MSCRAMM family adhesin SdrC [Terriglobia bacterium]
MKHMKSMVIATLLLLGISGAAAQSLGDYARAVRKNKAEPSSTSRQYDNDNLPTSQPLSVVGPPPAADAAPEVGDAKSNPSGKIAPADPAAAAAEHQKAADEWKKKLDAQQEKLDSLSRDLDVQQREYRLRIATMYNSQSSRLQNAGQWGKEDEQFRSDAEAKQKAIDAARQEMDEMQEQARKAGVLEKAKDAEKEKDSDNINNNDKDKDSDNIKSNDRDTAKDNDQDNTKNNDRENPKDKDSDSNNENE